MRKFLPIIGIVLLIGVISGGNYQYLINWSTAELVGFNFVTLLEIIGGVWLVYNGIKEIKSKKEIKN